jgi:hypothetical protein
MGRFRIYTDPPHPSGTRGQDTHVEFIDDEGHRHEIKNCKAAKVLVLNRHEPVELHLSLVGELEIDVSVEVTAAIIKQDGAPRGTPSGRLTQPTAPPIHQIPRKKK